MKIFNKEKGKEVVYVQRKDLKYILDYEKEVPRELIGRNYERIGREGLRDEFIIFYEEETVEFFKKINWIVDYRKVYKLPNEEIFKIVDNLFERYARNINDVYNDLDQERKYSPNDIGVLAQFYLNTMLSIPKLKNEDQFNLIPLVADGEGFYYESNALCICSTLKQNWFMIYNKMGRNMRSNRVPKEGLRALIAYFNGNNDDNWTWDLLKYEYPYTNIVTPDGKHILLGFYDTAPIKEKSNVSRLARVWDKNFNK